MLYLINLFLVIAFVAEAETFKVPLGLPEVPWPKDNPYTKAKADLGRILYFDKRLSANGTISCATCHHMTCGYSDCRVIAVGIDGKVGERHSPTIINAAYSEKLFWDGRASSLEEQCQGPLANAKEMAESHDAHEAHRECVDKIKSIPGYKKLFADVFGEEGITINTISKAIATFERTVLSGNSPYDRYAHGDKTAMTEEQIKGMHLFKKFSCVNCHGGFNFTDGRFQNIGVGMDAKEPDLGRYKITHDKRDWGSFKTPSLRDTEHSAPYMHDGSHATLEEVIDYYDKGGIKNKNLSPLMRPLNMTPEEKKALLSFLKALNGEGWQHIEEPKEFP